LYYNLIFKALFQSAQHLYEKKKGFGSEAGSEMLKIMRIRIPNTAQNIETGNAVLHRDWVILSYFVRETSTVIDADKSDVFQVSVLKTQPYCSLRKIF